MNSTISKQTCLTNSQSCLRYLKKNTSEPLLFDVLEKVSV